MWDKQIDEAVREFKSATGKTPNILLANDPTLGRFDFLANQARENIVRTKLPGLEPSIIKPTDWRELSGFQGKDYNLEFCIDAKLGESHFSLIFDENPDGDGGEPVPELDNVNLSRRTGGRKRKAA